MRSAFHGFLLAAAVAFPASAGQECIDCHKKTSPGVVADWPLSKHAKNGVDCSVCHGSDYQSAADVAKVNVGPEIQLMGQDPVSPAVPREKSHRYTVQFTH